MEICKRPAGIALLVAAVLGSGASLAQDAQQCTCLLPAAGDAAAPVGELRAVNGDVVTSQPAGYFPAVQGMPVALGSRIVVGANSSASLFLGENCPLEVSAGWTVRIDPSQAGICVSVDQPVAAQPVVEETPAPGSPNGLLGAALAAAAGAAGVALVVGSGDEDSVSD
jgi:hypothetical protein